MKREHTGQYRVVSTVGGEAVRLGARAPAAGVAARPRSRRARIAGSTSVNALCGRGESSIGTLPFVTRRRSAPLPLVGLSRCVRASGAMCRIDSPTLHWTWQFAGLAAEAHRQVGELARLTRTLAGVLHEAGGRRRNASSWRARSSPPSSKSVLSETRLRETIEVRPALGSWTPGGPRAASMSIPGTFRGMVAAGWTGLGF